jgi:drug/metabolite transporter (DMT)-like permease
MIHSLSKETQGYIWGFVGVLAFSFSLPFTRHAVQQLDPIFVSCGRAVIATIISAALLWFTKQPIPNRAIIARIAIVAFGVVIGFPLFSAFALRILPAGHSSIVIALMPLATAAGGALVQQQRPAPQFWGAALLGSVVVIGFIVLSSGVGIEWADMALLGAVLLGSLGYVEGGRLASVIGSWQTICWVNVLSMPFMIVPTVWFAPTQPINLSVWLAFGYLGAVSMCLGFFAWYRGLALGGIARVSQIQLIQAFLSIIWAGVLLNENITPGMWVAVTLVIACIYVAKKAPIYAKAQPHLK